MVPFIPFQKCEPLWKMHGFRYGGFCLSFLIWPFFIEHMGKSKGGEFCEREAFLCGKDAF